MDLKVELKSRIKTVGEWIKNFFYILNMCIAIFIFLTIIPIFEGIISALLNIGDKYNLILNISSSIELILFDVVLFVLFCGIYFYFLNEGKLFCEINVNEMTDNLKHFLSTPFLISICSILSVTILTIVLDLIIEINNINQFEGKIFNDFSGQNITDINLLLIINPTYLKFIFFFFFYSILLILIVLSILAICRLINVEKKDIN